MKDVDDNPGRDLGKFTFVQNAAPLQYFPMGHTVTTFNVFKYLFIRGLCWHPDRVRCVVFRHSTCRHFRWSKSASTATGATPSTRVSIGFVCTASTCRNREADATGALRLTHFCKLILPHSSCIDTLHATSYIGASFAIVVKSASPIPYLD